MIKKILVSQPKPSSEKSPYYDIAQKFDVDLVFRPFIKVEGITAKEFRTQKVNILDYTAIVFTSRHAIDHFFTLAKELRVAIPEDMKYFCVTETISLYIQKYVQYRKRKVADAGRADLRRDGGGRADHRGGAQAVEKAPVREGGHPELRPPERQARERAGQQPPGEPDDGAAEPDRRVLRDRAHVVGLPVRGKAVAREDPYAHPLAKHLLVFAVDEGLRGLGKAPHHEADAFGRKRPSFARGAHSTPRAFSSPTKSRTRSS